MIAILTSEREDFFLRMPLMPALELIFSMQCLLLSVTEPRVAVQTVCSALCADRVPGPAPLHVRRDDVLPGVPARRVQRRADEQAKGEEAESDAG